MQPELYTDMARLEDQHFWFRGRREILTACLRRRLSRSSNRLIVDAGCGTGANLQVLNQFGEVLGIDLHLAACQYAAAKNPGRLLQGSLESLPLRNESCSVAALFDVLEHIDDQQRVLGELRRILSPGGVLLVTVPAFRHLWSSHDVAHRHCRRYRTGALHAELHRAGFQVEYLSYFNTLLYPLIAVVRLLRCRSRETPASDMQLPPSWINALLYRVFRLESLWVGRCSAPFGVSLLAMAKKTGATGNSD